MEFVHPSDEEVQAIGGWYQWEKEDRLTLDGRAVLYLVGNGMVDSSCCGVGGCRFARVAGFVVRERARQNEDGSWVSEVEPLEDARDRERVTDLLMKREFVQQVQFF